ARRADRVRGQGSPRRAKRRRPDPTSRPEPSDRRVSRWRRALTGRAEVGRDRDQERDRRHPRGELPRGAQHFRLTWTVDERELPRSPEVPRWLFSWNVRLMRGSPDPGLGGTVRSPLVVNRYFPRTISSAAGEAGRLA